MPITFKKRYPYYLTAAVFFFIITFYFYFPSNKVDPAWNIPKIELYQALTDKSDNKHKYTIFDNKNVTYRNKDNLAELYYAVGGDITELVSLKPGRILLHEVIVQAIARYRWQDVSKLHEHIKQVVADLEQTSKTQKVFSQLDLYRQEILKKLNNKKNIESDIKFQSNYQPGVFINDYTKKQAAIDIILDKKYNKRANLLVSKLVANYYDNYFRAHKDDAISYHKNTRPYTVMLAGGPASGKSTYSRVVKMVYEQNGIDWQDVVKVNTDDFKSLLITPDSDAEQFFSSQLVQPEAYLLSDVRLRNYIGDKIKKKKIKHVLWDQVLVDPVLVNWGLMHDGFVAIKIVFSDTDRAVARSFERGKSQGRYEPTKLILDYHKQVTAELPEKITKFAGKNVFISILDNNGSEFAAKKVFEVFSSAKYAVIHDQDKLKSFISKLGINNQASNKQELAETESVDVKEYLLPLVSSGYNLRFKG